MSLWRSPAASAAACAAGNFHGENSDDRDRDAEKLERQGGDARTRFFIDLIYGLILVLHFLVNAEKVFDTSVDLCLDTRMFYVYREAGMAAADPGVAAGYVGQ